MCIPADAAAAAAGDQVMDGRRKMVKKSKSKSTKKSKSKSKRKKGSKKPLFVQGIGVLSSIPFVGTPFESAFKSGVGTPLPTMDVKDNLGYDPRRLGVALNDLNQDANIGLIVTIGGSITLSQALKNPGGATQFFISLIGGRVGTPSPTSGYFLGGVSLESYRRNPLRIGDVKSKFSITSDDEFCLLSNPNSAMAPIETGAWINNRIVPANVDEATADPFAVFKSAFTSISALSTPKIKAVVTSADPFFLVYANHLVQAANDWITGAPRDRVVCYPLKDYGAHSPSGRHMFHGPDLKKAYKALGKKAREILSATTSPIGSIEDAPEEVM
jgi:hypothetical protein